MTSCPTHIPTLAELFDACGSDYHLSLDLKDGRRRAAVIDVVRRHAPELARPALAVPPRPRRAGRAAAASTPRSGWSTRPASPASRRGPSAGRRRSPRLGIDAVNLHHTDWTGGLTALFHRFERVCFGWDMQFEHVLRPALRMGIDGVFSDHVD